MTLNSLIEIVTFSQLSTSEESSNIVYCTRRSLRIDNSYNNSFWFHEKHKLNRHSCVIMNKPFERKNWTLFLSFLSTSLFFFLFFFVNSLKVQNRECFIETQITCIAGKTNSRQHKLESIPQRKEKNERQP